MTQLYKKQILEFYFLPYMTDINFLSPKNRPGLIRNALKDQNLAYVLVGKYKKWVENGVKCQIFTQNKGPSKSMGFKWVLGELSKTTDYATHHQTMLCYGW